MNWRPAGKVIRDLLLGALALGAAMVVLGAAVVVAVLWGDFCFHHWGASWGTVAYLAPFWGIGAVLFAVDRYKRHTTAG